MFDVKCPHCNKNISISERLTLLYKLHGTCTFCNRDYLPKKHSMLVSSGVLGCVFSLTYKTYYDVDIVSLVISTVLVVFVIQQFSNLFYSLEPLNDD